MSYEKQTWTTGDVITAEKLNHLEDGIESGGMMIVTITGNDTDGYTSDKTFAEIEAAYLTMLLVVRYIIDDGEQFYYLTAQNDAIGSAPASFMFADTDGDMFSIDADNAVTFLSAG